MALTFPSRSYVANAVAGTLSSPISNTSTSFSSSTSLSLWADVTGGAMSGQMVVAVEYGTANEEKILCTYSSGVFTIVQRNYNGETAFPIDSSHSHATGANFVLVWSATEAAEAQAAVQTVKNIANNTGTSQTPSTVTASSTNANGTSKYVATADHSHAIAVTGLQGPQGLQGAASTVQGPQGAQGAASTVQGPQGLQGAASTVQGPQGLQGLQGPQGTAVSNTSGWVSVASATITAGTTLTAITGLTLTLTGYTRYAVTFTGRAFNGNATGAQNLAFAIYANPGSGYTSYGQTQIFNVQPSTSQLFSTTAHITNAVATTSCSFQIYGYNAGATAGNLTGELLVIGIA